MIAGKLVSKKPFSNLLKSFVPAMNNMTSGEKASRLSDRSTGPALLLSLTISRKGVPPTALWLLSIIPSGPLWRKPT